MNAQLADTVLALFERLDAPAGSGLVVTELAVDMPLEVRAAVHHDRLVFLAQPPHSRWQAGFLPPVQRMSLRLELEER
ncbi:MAG TPA: hypothetical protein VFP36_13185 [Usitatibacter sp.]|nr:hypothetical protein [Usitatibacter sp.]